jgi:hypothetical protein
LGARVDAGNGEGVAGRRKDPMASPGESIAVVEFAIRRGAAHQAPLCGISGRSWAFRASAANVTPSRAVSVAVTRPRAPICRLPTEPKPPRPRGASPPQGRRDRVNYWGKDIILPPAGSAAALNCGTPGPITRPHGNLASVKRQRGTRTGLSAESGSLSICPEPYCRFCMHYRQSSDISIRQRFPSWLAR